MIRMDGIKHRFDANEGAFFARELESIESKLYEFKKRELKYREYIPVSNRDNPGAENITYYMFDKVGMAKVIANYADDLPRADIFGKQYSQRVRGLGVSFGYSTQEIRAALMANRPLDSMKADAARRALREKENNIAFNGDSDYGLEGFFTNSNIPTGTAPNGAATTPQWSTKTAAEILNDIYLGTSTVRTQSKGIHEANTLLLPQSQYDLIATKRINDINDKTILQHIKENEGYGLDTVDWLSTELDNTFTGSSDGAVYYERSAEVVEQRIPLELELLPVQERGLEFLIPGESRHGGVVVRYPLGCFFQYNI